MIGISPRKLLGRSSEHFEGSQPKYVSLTQRKRLWIYSSLWLNHADCPFAGLSVQTLGYAERILLDMEAELANLAEDASAKRRRDLLLSECSAHSVLWVFGLYEVLRTVREAKAPQFSALAALFERLEALRMPLAKHEAKKINGTAPSHYPTTVWVPEHGYVGWHFYNPRSGAMDIMCRTPLANEFLATML